MHLYRIAISSEKPQIRPISKHPILPNMQVPTHIIKPPGGARPHLNGVGLATINYNSKYATLRCLESIRKSDTPPDWICILDNSETDDGIATDLYDMPAFERTTIVLFRSEINLGFAGGSNMLAEYLFTTAGCSFVLFLNNDAIALPALIKLLKQPLCTTAKTGIAGPQVNRLNSPTTIDSLGITLYSSLMPANRVSLEDPYLGPTGGCAMMTREFHEDITTRYGYLFDSRYFCYCEDTDLLLRARICGWSPVFVNSTLALHEGQASSRKAGKSFITLHGVRNMIRTYRKLPLKHVPILARLKFWLSIALFVGSLPFRREIKVIPPIFKEIFWNKENYRKEAKISEEAISDKKWALQDFVSPRFYQKGYFVAFVRYRLIRGK
jgi:GT2 family glycosyltransferase